MQPTFSRRELAWHAVFWVVYFFLFYSLLAAVGKTNPLKTNHFYLEEIVFAASILYLVYSNVLYLIPAYLRISGIHWFLLFTALNILIYSSLRLLTISLSNASTESFAQTLLISTYIYLTHFPIALGYWMGKRTVAKEKEKALLEQEKAELKAQKLEADKAALESELAFLRMQFDPHFMFNTLNFLYARAFLTSKTFPENKKIATGIVHFADLMRYSLVQGKTNRVALQEELACMNKYLEIHQMQMDPPMQLSLTIEDPNQYTSHCTLLPLILVHFLENAFKHGYVQDPTDPLIVTLMLDKDTLRFYCHNQKATGRTVVSTGIGRKNTTRRLEIAYGTTYTLEETETETHYTTTLTLPTT